MKQVISIFFFVVVVSLLYTAVGQVLPQVENRPPPEIKAGTNIGTEALTEAGAGVFDANCSQCHKFGEAARGPDLASIGALAIGRAAERAADTGKPYTSQDYLVEALCKPGDYVVKGFGNIMPPQGKSMSGGQLLAVTAFLENLGGDATTKGTDVKPLERFGCMAAGAGGGAAAAEAVEVGAPEQVFAKYGCAACHAMDSDQRRQGPSLQGIGKRMGKGAIYESILSPDAVMAAGTPPYPKGMMTQTLQGNGFYEHMKPSDYKALVDWLAGH